jgi:peptidoglycan hydrolase-like protein with peptidoglycan-binding domain
MWRKGLIQGIVILSALAAPLVASGANFFPRDLRAGDEGLDVYNLQVTLNLNVGTQVSPSGPGAPGEETQTFGPLTAAALTRYQGARGLAASGVADGQTRAALEADLSAAVSESRVGKSGSNSVSASSAATRSASLQASVQKAVQATGAVSTSFQTGKMVLFPEQSISLKAGNASPLFGLGFNPGERYGIVIASTSKVFGSATASTTMTLDVRAPRGSAGAHKIYLESESGQRSNTALAYFSKDARPEISKISPQPIVMGEEVTIEGKGFGRRGNKVVTPFGTVSDLASSRRGGKARLVFTPEFALPDLIFSGGATTTVTTIYVVTPSGASLPHTVNVAL